MCEGSAPAIKAARVQATILTGRYRDDYLISKFNEQSSGCCSMCGSFPGSVSHYLSGHCPALRPDLEICLDHSLRLLSSTPYLLPPVLYALHHSIEDWVGLIVDPVTNVQVIKIKQEYGSEAIWPLYRLSRAVIWCMHRQRLRHSSQLN